MDREGLDSVQDADGELHLQSVGPAVLHAPRACDLWKRNLVALSGSLVVP